MARVQRKGRIFSLTEVFVAGTVVAFLVSGLPPLLAKAPSRSRVAVAHDQSRDIAEALVKFQHDLGRWPTMGTDGKGGVTTLVSGTGDPALLVRGAALNDRSGAGRSGDGDADLLANHLLENHPMGIWHYPSNGEQSWQGPYLSNTPLDPWGNPYHIRMVALLPNHPPAANKAVVVSAGPDGVLDTPLVMDRNTHFGGDDVGHAFFVR